MNNEVEIVSIAIEPKNYNQHIADLVRSLLEIDAKIFGNETNKKLPGAR